MDELKVLQFFGISLIPFVAAIVVYFIFSNVSPLTIHRPTLTQKQSRNIFCLIKYGIHKFIYNINSTEKGIYWWKQFWIGVIFGGVSILGFVLGVEVNTTNVLVPVGESLVVGNSTVAPVIAGVIFGWPSALLSAAIGVSYRALQFGFLQLPTCISIALAGILSAVLTRIIFNNHRPKWYFSMLCGMFVETLNMLLIFIFEQDSISSAYELIALFDLVCILFSMFTTAATSIAISLIEHKTIIPKKEELNNVANRVQIVLAVICLTGLAAMGVTVRGVADSKAVDDYSYTAEKATTNVTRDLIEFTTPLKDNLDNTNLGKFFNFVKGYGLGGHGVADRHSVSKKGFINIVAGKWLIDWIGKSSDPTLKEEIKIGTVIGASENSSIKYGTKLQINNQLASDCKFDEKTIYPGYCIVNGMNCLTAVKYFGVDDLDKGGTDDTVCCYVAVMIPQDEVLSSVGVSFRIAIYIDVMVFILIFTITSYFVRRKILKRIEIMDDGLEKIMDGDLNYEIHVEGYNEFNNLTNNINLTVGALKNYANEVEHRIESELQLARDIQMSSVLKAFPLEKNYNIYAKMEPAKEVGGDFYDYVKMNNGRVMFIVADVSGKGVPAALFMMRAKTLIKSLASTDMPIDQIVTLANKDLCTQNETGLFVTAWIGILDPNNGELRYVNAGHPNPLIKHDGLFTEFKSNGKRYPALAAFEDAQYDAEIAYLQPGDEIVLYTDGLTEAQNRYREMYTLERLLNIANQAKYFNAKQLLDEVTDDVVKYVDGAEQFDDMTLLVMRYLGNTDNVTPETAITLKARPTNSSIAVNFVESILTKFELSPVFIARVSIVVDELFANIAFYAYPDNYVGDATIEVDLREDCLYLNIVDSGKQFDPTAPRKTNLSKDIDERERGGLGIYIVKQTMDEMNYEFKDHHNVLHLMKRLTKEDKKHGK